MSKNIGTRRTLLLGAARIKYLLRDEFTTALAAGSVNGTAAKPGPGTRAVVDTNSKLSIAGGLLTFATGGAGGSDPRIYYAQITRVAGRLLLAKVMIIDEGIRIGLSRLSGSPRMAIMAFTTGLNIQVDTDDSNYITVGSYVKTIEYEMAVRLRANGHQVWIKGGAFTNWNLLWAADRRSNNPYPTAAVIDTSSPLTIDDIRIPDVLWTPTPLASDAFTRANAALGLTGGGAVEESGGDGLTWVFDAGIWTVDTNQAKGTPAVGSEMHTESNAAADPNGSEADAITGWASPNCDLISQDVEVDTGTYALKCDGTGASGRAEYLFTAVLGAWYQVTVALKRDDVSFRAQTWSNLLLSSPLNPATTAWTDLVLTTRATNANAGLRFYVPDTQTGYLDNLSLKPITLSALFASLEVSTTDVLIEAEVTLSDVAISRTQAGVVMNLDDAATPANFVIAYHDGTNANLDKCVAGVYTSVISAAAAYAAGAVLRVIKDGTSYSLYYNNAKVGSTSTISDAGIVDNVLHGLFSTYSANRLDNFAVWARGTDGEYAELEKY